MSSQFTNGKILLSPTDTAPECPECQGSTSVRQVSPMLMSPSLDEVVYGCVRCGTETKRTEARP